jgi:hypothetical protein
MNTPIAKGLRRRWTAKSLRASRGFGVEDGDTFQVGDAAERGVGADEVIEREALTQIKRNSNQEPR